MIYDRKTIINTGVEDVIEKLCTYIIHKDNRYMLVRVDNFLSNYNIMSCINTESTWCTYRKVYSGVDSSEESWNRLKEDGYFLRLYDNILNEIYSIYVKDNKIKHIIDSSHKRSSHLMKEWDIVFLYNLRKNG